MMELWRLFLAFLQIGLFSIGGGYAVIPAIQQQVVETYEWISQRVFTDILTISQMTPGPLAVNTSTSPSPPSPMPSATWKTGQGPPCSTGFPRASA